MASRLTRQAGSPRVEAQIELGSGQDSPKAFRGGTTGVVEQALSLRGRQTQRRHRGIDEPFLGGVEIVQQPLPYRQREEGEENSEHHDVPTRGLTHFHGLQILLQGSIPQGAQPPELETADLAARLREGGGIELTSETGVELEEFTHVALGHLLIRADDRRKLDFLEDACPVPFQENGDGRRVGGARELQPLREGGQGGQGVGRTQGAGERREVTGELLA